MHCTVCHSSYAEVYSDQVLHSYLGTFSMTVFQITNEGLYHMLFHDLVI